MSTFSLSPTFLSTEALTHFGLRDDPFADDLDVPGSPTWSFPALDDVRRSIREAVMRQRMIAIVAEPGAGKSTMIRAAVAEHARVERRARFCQVACIARSQITTAGLTEAIVRELTGRRVASMSPEARGEVLRETLAAERSHGNYPTLVIDEAHRLRVRSTERESSPLHVIKALWDSSLGRRHLAVILAGQPQLASELLQNAELVEVTRRMQIITMPPFGRAAGQTASDYLAWRLRRVGGEAGALFDAASLVAINDGCSFPLHVHGIASRALSKAHDLGAPHVTAAILSRAA